MKYPVFSEDSSTNQQMDDSLQLFSFKRRYQVYPSLFTSPPQKKKKFYLRNECVLYFSIDGSISRRVSLARRTYGRLPYVVNPVREWLAAVGGGGVVVMVCTIRALIVPRRRRSKNSAFPPIGGWPHAGTIMRELYAPRNSIVSAIIRDTRTRVNEPSFVVVVARASYPNLGEIRRFSFERLPRIDYNGRASMYP